MKNYQPFKKKKRRKPLNPPSTQVAVQHGGGNVRKRIEVMKPIPEEIDDEPPLVKVVDDSINQTPVDHPISTEIPIVEPVTDLVQEVVQDEPEPPVSTFVPKEDTQALFNVTAFDTNPQGPSLMYPPGNPQQQLQDYLSTPVSTQSYYGNKIFELFPDSIFESSDTAVQGKNVLFQNYVMQYPRTWTDTTQANFVISMIQNDNVDMDVMNQWLDAYVVNTNAYSTPTPQIPSTPNFRDSTTQHFTTTVNNSNSSLGVKQINPRPSKVNDSTGSTLGASIAGLLVKSFFNE